jgi:4-amino-4-deoxy-L-arabinose transferase-like glycosyltransferase
MVPFFVKGKRQMKPIFQATGPEGSSGSIVPMVGEEDNLLVRYRMVFLLVVVILIYVPWLGFRDLWYPDEPDIAEVCRAMFQSGDWIVPRLHGEIWVTYPPMVYWAGSISSYLLGGMSEFTLRLPSALAAIGLVLATCAAGSRWFGQRTGLWAGLVLATSWQFFWEAIAYRPDMLFGLFIGLGLFTYLRGVEERPRWGPRIVGFAFLGLAVLTKGPLGLLLPGLVLALWHGTRREWRPLLDLVPLSLVSLAVSLPWYIACAQATGAKDIVQEMYLQNIGRFGSGFRGHGRPPYYYLVQIWADLAPWSVLLPFAVWGTIRAKLWRDRYMQLALWWFGTFFIFLSIAVTKRQLYLLPAYPAAALLLAQWVSTAIHPKAATEIPSARPARLFVAGLDIGLLFSAVLAFAAVAAMGTAVSRLKLGVQWREVVVNLRTPILVLGITALAAGLWVRTAWRRGQISTSLSRLAFANVLVYLLLVSWLIPAFNPIKTYVPQCRWIREQIDSETEIGLVNLRYGNHKRGAFEYYTGVRVDLLETRADLERFFREHPRSLVLVHKGVAGEFFAGDNALWSGRVAREFTAGGYSYLVLRGP